MQKAGESRLLVSQRARLVCPAVAHRFADSFLGEVKSGCSGRRLGASGVFEDGSGILLEFLFDLLKRGGLGTAVILDAAADYSAGIGDKVGNANHSSFMQDSFGRIGAGNVGTLQH